LGKKIILAAMIILLGTWFVFPAYFTLQTSFMTKFALVNPVTAWRHSSLGNWKMMPWGLLLGWLRNSLIVCCSLSILTLLVCVAAGYGFAKFDFPMKDPLFWLFLVAMIVPGTLLFLPRYLITRDMKILNTHVAMILPLILSPSMVFLSRQYLLSISNELLDAGRVDGASEVQIFRYIVLPLVKPLIVLAVLGGFSAGWGDFMWQYIVARNRDIQTMTVGLGLFMMGSAGPTGSSLSPEFTALIRQGISLEGMQAVAAILQSAPMLALFAFGQKYFLQGIKLGAPE